MATLTLKKKPQSKAVQCDQWLKTFPAFQSHCLLAIGMIHQLKAEYQAANSVDAVPSLAKGFPFKSVRYQIAGRTRKPWYLKLAGQGSMRYNLDGSEYAWQAPIAEFKNNPN